MIIMLFVVILLVVVMQHSFFAEMCARPVHLVVDTRLVTDNINVTAYVQANSAAVRE